MDTWYDCKESGLEKYEYNWNGEVRNKTSGKILKKKLFPTGRIATSVWISDKKKSYTISPFQIRKYHKCKAQS
jgi:hypothetical protein